MSSESFVNGIDISLLRLSQPLGRLTLAYPRFDPGTQSVQEPGGLKDKSYVPGRCKTKHIVVLLLVMKN